jgi:hypothetical protein
MDGIQSTPDSLGDLGAAIQQNIDVLRRLVASGGTLPAPSSATSVLGSATLTPTNR